LTTKPTWAGDTSPSLPEANTKPRRVVFGGFCWGDYGIAHDIDAVTIERLRVPPLAPDSMRERS